MLGRILIFMLWAAVLLGQNETGELRLTVTDQAGLPVPSIVEIFSSSSQYRRSLEAVADGKVVAKRLPFGVYRVTVRKDGFNPYSVLIEVRSAIPLEKTVTLALAGIDTTVVVTEGGTLIDPHRTGEVNRIGSDALRDRPGAAPGRSIIDLVNTQPGWLLEANAVLHPRGSEYQTQYVVNGIPLTDNRSPSFAPEIEADEVESMNVLTANYPAEYGRKLGGVIEVNTVRDTRQGFHGQASASGGSFATAGGYLMGQYGWGRNTLSVSADSARTDRYLDPPVEQNYTNQGTAGSFSAHYERDLTDADRLGVVVRREQARFLVPNEQVQETAGQRQDRDSYETVGQLSYQHVFAPWLLGDVRVMSRDVAAGLWSNPLATPIIVSQDRGFREGYLKASVSAHRGRHELKAGVEADFGSVREALSYGITNPQTFDPNTPPQFRFADRAQDREQALFVQDLVRLGNWTLSAGLRWDHYRLVTDESAASPRLGAAWYWPRAGLVLRASFDRAFQTPAFENLLLASSPAVIALNDSVLRLPVRPSIGNFYEAGFTKGLFDKLRLEANWFRRDMNNFADDDVLLNTGVSFPIAFRKAEIRGVEVKLEVPRWGKFSGWVSYSNMMSFGYLPVTGGLFLGDDASTMLNATDRFPTTQDQRNTVRSRVRYQLTPRAWVSMGGSYGSGLPVEFNGTRDDAIAQYGARIVDRLNLERGRVRPSFSLDASAGVDLWKNDRRTVRVQADAANLTNRLNVINFAGLFSGTAIAPPRSYSVRLAFEF
jgi:outer membrane cobalamin receptor